MAYLVYILRCVDGTLYTGITTDLTRRVAEHNSGKGAKYTRARLPVAPVYWETAPDKSAALRRELDIKALTRPEKLALIEAHQRKGEISMERGRFAPSPSGRMHLGNLLAALLAWLDVRHAGGTMVLRMEDLDPDRCREEYAAQVARDLEWLGLDWDEGYGAGGSYGPYRQSERGDIYQEYLNRLEEKNLIYPCWCTRAQRLAASAPHLGENQGNGACPCRSLTQAERQERYQASERAPALRAAVPDGEVSFTDGNCGEYTENLMRDCGDFLVRRSDGVCAYQLAVTVDDGLMGVTRVVRGRDLLSSTPWQIWLHQSLGFEPPKYFHTPLLLAQDGRRLSKRERDLDMGTLRARYTPEEIIGRLAALAGLLEQPEPVAAKDLITAFDWQKVAKNDVYLPSDWFAP